MRIAVGWIVFYLLSCLLLACVQRQPASVQEPVKEPAYQPIPALQGECLKLVGEKLGALDNSHIAACGGVQSYWSLRCVKTLVDDFGRPTAKKLWGCTQIQSEVSSSCIDGVAQKMGSMSLQQMRACSQLSEMSVRDTDRRPSSGSLFPRAP